MELHVCKLYGNFRPRLEIRSGRNRVVGLIDVDEMESETH